MLDIDYIQIVLRVLAAMLIGFVIGGQRERTGHPAGLRTHMLVALGACVVMVTGAVLTGQTFLEYGATPDPARLGAQVVSGVGFLGAGAILKDGFSVRGLTTAASLWSVACLGLAAGAGQFFLAGFGTAAIFLTLMALDRVQVVLRKRKEQNLLLEIECEQMNEVLVAIDGLTNRHFATLQHVSFNRTQHNTYVINADVFFPSANFEFSKSQFMQSLAGVDGIVAMRKQDMDS